jgi:hypothetical protein
MGSLVVTFTGICAFYKDGSGKMIVLLPNNSKPCTIHGGVLPGHFAYIKLSTSTPNTPLMTAIKRPAQIPFVKIENPAADEAALEILRGMKLALTPQTTVNDGFIFTDSDDAIHMSKIIEYPAIDDCLIDSQFDPDERRIAARMDITRGIISVVRPDPQKVDVLEFKPRYNGTYRRRFAQEIRWDLPPAVYDVAFSDIGEPSSGTTTLWTVDAQQYDIRIEIGNAPLEDAMFPEFASYSDIHEPVDLHFHLYYNLCKDLPSVHPLPNRVSGIKTFKRVGGVNCPPVIFS